MVEIDFSTIFYYIIKKYIYITVYDIEKILKRIDMYESWESECDLEDKLRHQNDRNKWYDSWD